MSKIFNNFFIDVDFLNHQEISNNNFNKILLEIRKKLHIKHSRKTEVDSLLKKAKCKFFQSVHKVMKYCLSINVNRLPQVFITNINIEYNRNYLEKTIIQIYNGFDLIQSQKVIDDEVIKIKNKKLFKIFTQYKLYELYAEYIESNCYKKDKNKVIIKNGKNIGILYEFVAKNFIFYYMSCKNKITKIDEYNNKIYHKYNKKDEKQKIGNEEEVNIVLEN